MIDREELNWTTKAEVCSTTSRPCLPKLVKLTATSVRIVDLPTDWGRKTGLDPAQRYTSVQAGPKDLDSEG